MSTVLVMGAGASVHAGGPTMMNFLDRAEAVRALHGSNMASKDAEAFDTVFKGAASLQIAQAKSQIDLLNIESLFSAFEMADMLGIELAGSDRHAEAIRRVIYRTLQYEMALTIEPVRRHEQWVVTPARYYNEFAGFLESNPGHVLRPTIITFNYDIGLDYAFYYNAIDIDYGFGTCTARNPIKLLKLHGSLNWADTADRVQAIDLGAYIGAMDLTGADRRLVVDLTPGLEKLGGDGLPFIVPPTWNKWNHQARISQVWSEAAKALKGAERLAIIGYSLPETDQFFRYLFALGVMGDTRIKEVLVVDPAPAAHHRFQELLAQGTERRFKSETDNWEHNVELKLLLQR